MTQSELREIATSDIKNYVIGIGIKYKIDSQTKIPTIIEVFEKYPADLGNIKVGDQILEINGISTSRMNSEDVSNLIRGDVNTTVFLRISRTGFRDTNTMLIRQLIINPNLDKRYLNRCLAHLELKDYSKALDDCNEAVKINPNNDKAYFFRATVHFKLGNKYEAMNDLRKAANLGNEKARDILSR